MTEALEEAVFPPMLSGLEMEGSTDPFAKACAEASLGCDAGLVVFNRAVNRLSAAIVFAPEVPLRDAMAMLPLCQVGFQNAMGALAPPEVAVHIGWPDQIFINGASCGRFQADASGTDPDAIPDWLVIGFHLPLMPENPEGDHGHTPDQTTLYEEGCADIDPTRLLESWSRHTLVWLNRWLDEGDAPLHREWRGIVRDIGEEIEIDGRKGTFVGLDEKFGMLLRDKDATHLLPLSGQLGKGPRP